MTVPGKRHDNMWLSKCLLCIFRIDNKRPLCSPRRHMQAPRAPRCHSSWAVPGNRGAHCEGRLQRLSTKQGIGKPAGRRQDAALVPRTQSARAKPGCGRGPGTKRGAFILSSAPQRKHGHHCLVQRPRPEGCCLAMGNVKKNRGEKG